MTLEEFDRRPRENWDFCELWDDLREALVERDLAIKQRNTARKERDGMVQRRYRWKEAVKERDEAQEAAETYHEAWQDAAIYWKDKVARLELELDDALGLGDFVSEEEEEERLRSALRTYGQHLNDCRVFGGDGPRCYTCGFDRAMGE